MKATLIGCMTSLVLTLSGATARADSFEDGWADGCYWQSYVGDDGYGYFSRDCEDGSGEFDDNDGQCEWTETGETIRCTHES